MARRNAIPRNTREAHARERVLATIATTRRDHQSPTAAAKAHGTTLKTVLRYGGSTLHKTQPHGRYVVSSYDRLARTLNVLTPHGLQPFTVRDSRTATRIAKYMNAVGADARSNLSALKPFEGKSFRTTKGLMPFVTDRHILDQLANADELGIEKLYFETQGPHA